MIFLINDIFKESKYFITLRMIKCGEKNNYKFFMAQVFFDIHDIIVRKHNIFYSLFLLKIIVGRNNINESSQKAKKIFFIKF